MIYSRRCNIPGLINLTPIVYSKQLAISAVKILLVAAKQNPWAVSIEEVRSC